MATGALTSPPTRSGASGAFGGGASVITPPMTPPTTPPGTPPSTPPSTPPVTPASAACVATGCTFSGTVVGAISWRFFGTSTGFTTCTAAALGGGGGGGGGGGAEATEYCATWAGEFVGKSTFQIAPTTTATTTTTCSATETGSVRIRWIPTFCFLDSTTVDSNIVFTCIRLTRSRYILFVPAAFRAAKICMVLLRIASA